MSGFKALRSFFHDKQYMTGDIIDLPKDILNDFEDRGLVIYFERPEIIMPKKEIKEPIKVAKKTTKRKKNVHKGQK